jgi:hypothetical protein
MSLSETTATSASAYDAAVCLRRALQNIDGAWKKQQEHDAVRAAWLDGLKAVQMQQPQQLLQESSPQQQQQQDQQQVTPTQIGIQPQAAAHADAGEPWISPGQTRLL